MTGPLEFVEAAHKQAEEQAKTEALARRIAEAIDAHRTHRAAWRKDTDGFHRCPQCDPYPPVKEPR